VSASPLAAPWTLRGRAAPCRILFGPHETNLGDGRTLSDRHAAYYEARAAGGAGVIVLEEASVHPLDWPYERAPLASACGESWREVGGAIHRHGALALAALGHSGGQGSSAFSQRELWGPSPVPEVPGREVPKAMEAQDIAEVLDGFAAATRLALAAGLDGVEVNAGQRSLLRTFMSGMTNHRGDAYGEDRLRLLREVLEAVRRAASEAIVGLRLGADELFPHGGILPEEGAAYAAQLADLVDYVVPVRGSIYSVAATRPDGHDAPGFNRGLAAAVRAAVDGRTQVVLQGSVVDVADAASALEGGDCDAVEMTRAQIADAGLAGKLAAGAPERIRPCVLCNQACMVRDPRNPVLSCVADPDVGHESGEPPLEPAGGGGLELLVVGGGPAGLECARVAALAGHRVRLVEREDELGGMLRIAAAQPGHERLALLADWLERECRAAGVELVTGHEADEHECREAEALVLCTGSLARAPGPYSVVRGARVLGAVDVLAAARRGDPATRLPAGRIAVLDPIGGPTGIAVAERLAPHRAVVLVTPDGVAGQQLSLTGDLAPANVRLHQAGVAIVRRRRVLSVRQRWLELEHVLTAERSREEAAALIDCGHRLPDPLLAEAELARAGDAVAPRSALEAILEGRRAAASLSRALAGAR
jgi:2,4-dienoyl-CoA reductase (NADPH2)